MHRAPSVSYAVLRTRVQGLVWVGFLFLTGLAGLLWVQEVMQPGWRLSLFAGFSLLCLAWGLESFLRAPCGTLAWNSQSWLWIDARGDCPVVTRVRLDFQSLMLLELSAGRGRTLWIWLHRRATDRQWTDLRRALHSREKRPSDATRTHPGNGTSS